MRLYYFIGFQWFDTQLRFLWIKKSQKNLVSSRISITFAPLYETIAFRQVRSGCSSVRLEYASGGRGVASSNLVTPTSQKVLMIIDCRHFFLVLESFNSSRYDKTITSDDAGGGLGCAIGGPIMAGRRYLNDVIKCPQWRDL